MKFATLRTDDAIIVAAISPETNRYWPLSQLLGRPVNTMVDIITTHKEIKEKLVLEGAAHSLTGVTFLPPLTPTRNIMCVGKNYHAHAREFTKSGFDSSARNTDEAIPTAPIIFTKPPETIIANNADIWYPEGVSDSVDYEAELGVIIGKCGRGISKKNALDHVFGYTIINDMTARDLQAKHKQWFIGKSLDTFCPMGPYIATADEVDITNLSVQCWVNGELRQNANTSDMIFDVPTLIETLSQGMTLQPGDVIATGTPAGVGIGFNPPRYLARGDEVAIEITGLGRLSNRLA